MDGDSDRTTAQLEENRDKLVYLARVATWQSLARKMAYEVKNSLTPIRLIMDEVATLERQARSFGGFAAGPTEHRQPLELNTLLEERVAFLQPGQPATTYDLALSAGPVRGRTYVEKDPVAIAIEDNGPGLSQLAKDSRSPPTITFKKGGLGLGLSIADAVETIHAGAFGFRKKPSSRDRVLVAIKNALEADRLKAEDKERRQRLVAEARRMIGGSSALKRVLDQATLAERTDSRVLFLGENRTGKSLLAGEQRGERGLVYQCELRGDSGGEFGERGFWAREGGVYGGGDAEEGDV